MHWVWLGAAIGLEVSGTVCMRLSNGFTKATPSILMAILYTISFACLTIAIKKVDVGVAYAIWSGVGTALITGIGIAYFREPLTALKMVSVGLIIMGIVGLKLSGGTH